MTYPIASRNRKGVTDFLIGENVGEGSLSKVFRARECATGRDVAVKTFCRKYLRSNRKDADVVIEEHCLRRLNHPSVVKFHALFGDEASTHMVLEYCPGGELWCMVRHCGCSDAIGRHYLAQVVEGVSYLRDAGVVHRDLKAENVLIGANGNAKLIDFGAAKDLANPHVKGAGTRSFKQTLEDNVGTANFMAPEVQKNKFSDHRSDTWSLGCLFYQVMTGLPPFGVSLLRVYSRSRKARLLIPPGVGDDAADLIRRMVVLNPNARLGAADIRELRAHPFFKHVDAVGSRLEGACRRPAPVPSLEELCLRAICRSWPDLANRLDARRNDLSRPGSLRPYARQVLRRRRRAVMRDAVRDRRAQLRCGPKENGESTTDTEEEVTWDGGDADGFPDHDCGGGYPDATC